MTPLRTCQWPSVRPRFDGSGRGTHTSAVHAIVVDHLAGDPAVNARTLAQVLGNTIYECRVFANAPHGGPVVVECHARSSDAEAVSARLRAAGLVARAVDVATETEVLRFVARTFELGTSALSVHARDGRSLELPYQDIDVLVRGSRMEHEVHTETTTSRKLDVGRAVLTGGLMVTRTEKTTRTTTSTDAQGFVVVWAGPQVAVVLEEQELQYQSLGPAMQPSRTANFAVVLNALRQRCGHARWDDRLLRRGAQQQLLGPTLDADQHLGLAIALVAMSVRSKV
jgi:hypothetical protein